MTAGLGRRIYLAQGIFAGAWILSLACMVWSGRERESAVLRSRLAASFTTSFQTAALSCRRYLETVLGGTATGIRPTSSADVVVELRRSKVFARNIGAEGEADEIARLERFVGASGVLVERIARLERDNRREEAAVLRESGLRPLMEEHLGGLLAARLEEETAERNRVFEAVQRWSRGSRLFALVFAALTLAAGAFWTRCFVHYVLSNIERVRRALAAVGSGNFSVHLGPEGDDELGRLQQALNEMARRLETAQRRLVESERSSAFAQLAAGAAHAINNPLSAVIGYAELLLRHEGLDAKAQGDVRIIRDQGRRCDAIIRNLRQFAGRRVAAQEPVQVNEILQKMGDLLRPGFEAGGTALETSLDRMLPVITANPGELQQVFYNLLTNASQAVDGMTGARILVTTAVEGERVLVVVEDNGVGIPPESLKRVFDPFFTTRPPGEGAGLGLSSALGIVKDHGGEIGLTSRPGAGSRFEVRLPLRAPQAVDPLSRAAAGGKVLVVDDEREILALAGRILRRAGFDVTCVGDAPRALEEAARGGFSLLLSDYRMPGMDGRQLFEAVRLRWPDLAERFIFSTGEIVSPEFQLFVERHRIPILLKPFDMDELLRTVRARLEAAGAHREAGGS